MKIAIVHSEYRSENPSGENRAVRLQSESMSRSGHDVTLFLKNTDSESERPFYKVRSALRVAWGGGASFLGEIASLKPDIVHVHNIFPNLGWKWLAELDAPLVATLHNYRTVCAAGTAMLRGAACSLCQDQGSYNAVVNSCYQGSALKTVPLAIQTRKPFLSNPLVDAAAGIVLLSRRMADIFEPLQINKKKWEIIPNFVPENPRKSTSKNGRWAWVGRISGEKGLASLISSWPENYFLDVFGDGPLRFELESQNTKNIQFFGEKTPEDLRSLIPSYQGIVISSEWPETAVNLVHLEAMAAGLPVVARAGSTSADEVCSYGGGSVYDSPEELKEAIEKWSVSTGYSSAILDRFYSEFSEAAWQKKILQFYDGLL